MTTEQIVKALRVCGESRFCKECPSNELKDTMGVYPCADLLMMKAADLIEQQAARIAELEAKVPRWIPVTKMADFIEVHQLGKPRLVNLDWVEEIWPTENGTQIYFAFTCPDATSQDFITADESYDKIKRMLD